MVHEEEQVAVDRVSVEFDDERAVSDAGVMLVATLAERLGIEALAGRLVQLRRDRPGAANAGRKVMALLFAMVLGADSIDDCELLRAGRTRRLLGGWAPAPSTLGTFLRAFTFGHVRQLDALLGRALERAWQAGAGPGADRLVIDVDSFVGEVCGRLKQGAAYGYTRVLGYHPLVATWAVTGEVLHARLRKGSSQRGHKRFVEELIARVRRAGATGALVVRADAGFFSYALIDTLSRLGVAWSITVHINPHIRACIEAIDESAWEAIVYPDGGAAQVAETTYVTGAKGGGRCVRLVVRRTRLSDPTQEALWPDWRHHAFITDLAMPSIDADRFHRAHATVELAIRDLKENAGLEHCPSGKFFANAAWLGCAVLAHNLFRWTVRLGNLHHDDELTVARTVRSRLVALPGRLVNRSGRLVLRLPDRWPWATTFTIALDCIRALPLMA